MKTFLCRRRSGVSNAANPAPARLARRAAWAWLTVGGLWLGSAGHAADPGWWRARGAVDANALPAPNAVVNQGQLKAFTSAAVQELNASLARVGGAGEALNDLVTGWQVDYAVHAYATDTNNPTKPYKPGDFEAVSAGQLKYVAGLFYQRLQQGGYVAAPPPWLAVNPATDDQLAVLGQLKTVFAFDLGLDPSGSGLPVAWEQQYFQRTGVDPDADADGDGLTNLQEFQGKTDPNDFFNGVAPVLTKVSGDAQTGAKGGLLPAALTVRLTSAAGHPLFNAPVSWQLISGGGQLQTNSRTVTGNAALVRTDGAGLARVYFQLPNVTQANCQIRVAAAGSSQVLTQTSQVFQARSDAGGGGVTYDSPFGQTNVIETVNPDGSEDLHWTNNPDNLEDIPLWSLVNGTWTQVGSVPAGTTSHHFDHP